MRPTFALLLGALLAGAAHAEVYQWKDEQGRIHFGQEVPAKYQKSAVRKDTTQVNVMKASEAAKPRGRSEAPAETPREEDGAEDDAPRTPEEQCAAEKAAYEDAQACLKQFLNAFGRVTAEGAEKCPQVPRPACMMRQ